MIKLPIEIGDIILVGRFKNKRIKVKEIGIDMLDETDYTAEWNPREGYWLFPEEETTYDSLEAELEREFSKRGINARFEGIF